MDILLLVAVVAAIGMTAALFYTTPIHWTEDTGASSPEPESGRGP